MPEIYILDRLTLDRIRYVENYESFIWTTRRSEFSDCKLVIPLSEYKTRYYREFNYIERPESNRLMMIVSILKKESEGTVTITGHSLEKILEERVIPPSNDDDAWTINGSVGYAATEYVRRICIEGEYSNNDIINNLDYEEQDASTIQREVKPTQGDDLYKVVKGLCDEDDLGFRIFLDRPTKKFIFRVNRGVDRTVDQNERPPVVFSQDLDSLTNESFLKSIEGYKNVAYVKYKGGAQTVYDGTMYASTRRRVLFVDATDIENPTPGKVEARGRIELRKHNRKNLFDGEVERNKSYTYEVDYEIGDLVTLRSVDGETRTARVTEFVSTFDQEGVRYFPTFTSLET